MLVLLRIHRRNELRNKKKKEIIFRMNEKEIKTTINKDSTKKYIQEDRDMWHNAYLKCYNNYKILESWYDEMYDDWEKDAILNTSLKEENKVLKERNEILEKTVNELKIRLFDKSISKTIPSEEYYETETRRG